MAADTSVSAGSPGARSAGIRAPRRTDETKAAFKTTEFIAYVAVLAGVFIAGLVIKGSGTDELQSPQVWLYAVILTFGYMLSRGIAKSGSRHAYTDDDR
jgi:hypothetical protein